MLDYTESVAKALEHLNILCCEEPMREIPKGPYITYRNLGRRTIYASRLPYAQYATMAAALHCPAGGGWQSLADSAAQALRDAGFEGVRVASESWDENTQQRVITLYCYAKELT